MLLPDRVITPQEYEIYRKLHHDRLGIRYYRLSPKKRLDATLTHNCEVLERDPIKLGNQAARGMDDEY